MRKFAKSLTALLLVAVVFAMSMVSAFAVEYDHNDITYSYSEKGDCTVVVGDVYYASNSYIQSNEFEVNGRVAVCAWGVNPTPTAGTYRNATKYYLDAGAARAKAFYWLLLDNKSSISASNRYDSSSTTYLDDIHNAMDDCGALYKSTSYGFVHGVIDYLQQGTTNPWYDDDWNDAIVKFAELTRNYPSVPKEYRIFYFYPEGNAAQSLMSWEHSPHGYIKVIKSSANPSVSDGKSEYSFKGIEYYVSKSKTDFDTSGSNYLGYIKLNEAGEGHSKDGSRETLRNLAPGTYYIKEGYIPSGNGYERDNNVYTVTVTKDNTTTNPVVLRVSDEPKTCYGKIVKASTKPELTDDNPEYSFAGIRYSFSTDSSDFDPKGNHYIGYVELNEEGEGYTENGSRETLRKLAPGTYYVKESVIPEGCKYKQDKTVYTMTFTFENDKNHLKVLNVKDEPEGSSSVKVVKKSSLPEITNGNPLYSFEGAEFTIYRTKADAENGANPYTKITTDENGVALASDIELGTYFIKETKAPANFELSEEIKELNATAVQDEAYEVEFEDKPVVATISVLLQKKDARTGELGGTRMINAEYTFRFYTEYLDTVAEVEAATPSKVWVFRTDETGNCCYDAEHFVSGSELFLTDDLDCVIPLGTLAIQESKAPEDYLIDDTVFIRKITADGADNVIHYQTPISSENPIPEVSLSVNKVWNDDDDRDGVQPDYVTILLDRDGQMYDSTYLNEGNNWSYEFNGLPEGYVDSNGEYKKYVYDMREAKVEKYSTETTGLKVDPNDSSHYICTFTNTYHPKTTEVGVSKGWRDFDDLFGFRPESIIVDLYQDGKKIAEKTVTEKDGWRTSFKNLPVCHDHGKKYAYTIKEEPVEGYSNPQYTSNTIINPLDTGSVTALKTDEKGNPLEGVKFKLYSMDITNENGLYASLSSGIYRFEGVEAGEGLTNEFVTDASGQIKIDNLPAGSYELREVSTLFGYMPYEEAMPFTLELGSEKTMNVTVEVANAKSVLMNTGGSGDHRFYTIAFVMAGLGAIPLCLFFIKRKTKSNSSKKGKMNMKRLFALMITIMMLAAVAIPGISAASTNTLDTAQKVSVTMNCDKPGYEFKLYKVADLIKAVNPYTVRYDVKVTSDTVKNAVADGNIEESERASILKALDKDKALTGATEVGTFTTSDTSKTKSFSDLDQGIYYVRATNFPAGVKRTANSCFALPYYAADNGWTYTIPAINLADKVEDDEPEIFKEITNSTKNNVNFSDVSIGDTVEFEITTDTIGALDEASDHKYKLNSYFITDVMSKGLTLNKDSFVLSYADENYDVISVIDPKYYTITINEEEGKDTTFTVALKKAYLNSDRCPFYNAAYILTDYSAVLNKYATTEKEGNPNDAVKLTYSNENDVVAEVEGNTVYVYTYQIEVHKTDESGTKLQGAEFALYKTESDAKDEKNAIATGTSDADGVVKFKNASSEEMLVQSGRYFIKETKAPDGYNKYTDVIPVNINVTYSRTLTNGTYIENAPENGVAVIEVKNSKTVLPQTGGVGNYVVYGIAGLLAAAGVTVFIISRKKKDQKN